MCVCFISSVESVSPVNCCWFSQNWIRSEKQEKLDEWLMIRGRRSCNWSRRRSAIKPIVMGVDSLKATTETINLLSLLRFLSRHTAIKCVLSAERGFLWIEMFLISVFLLGINANYWHLRGGIYSENVTVATVIWRQCACENVWHFITCFVSWHIKRTKVFRYLLTNKNVEADWQTDGLWPRQVDAASECGELKIPTIGTHEEN